MVWQQPGSAQAIVPGERRRVDCLVKVAVELMEMECSGRVWELVRRIREVRAVVYPQEEVGISATDVGRPESDWVVCLE